MHDPNDKIDLKSEQLLGGQKTKELETVICSDFSFMFNI